MSSAPTFMEEALRLAGEAAAQGEVPVGAVLVDSRGRTLAVAFNRTELLSDPTAHAEMLAIQEGARRLGAPRLENCDLYVTLEPCAMCAAAISFARIRRLYFGAGDTKMGAVDHGPRFFTQPTCHHVPETYGGLMEEKSKALLQEFFRNRRG